MINIESVIHSANKLEPLPHTVTRLIELLSNEQSSIATIEKVLSADGPLTSRLLRMANSAAMGGRDQVGTIHAAVVRLGVGSILAMAVAAGSQKQLDVPIPAYGLREGDLWKHAQAARLAVGGITRYAKVDIAAEAPTAALLHDIGKVVLARYLGSDEIAVLDEATHGRHIAKEAEMEVLQVHHGELGGLIAQHWNLPDIIVRGIIYHHDPHSCECDDNTICHVVALADWVGKATQAALQGETFHEPVPDSATVLGIADDKIERIVEQTVDQMGSW